MITPIRNQPINFLPIVESDSCLCDISAGCSILDRGKDWVSFQFKNPANDLMDQICADQVLKVSNTFSSSTGMTASHFNYDGAGNRFCSDIASGIPVLSFTTNHFTSGKYYRIRALISNSDPGAEFKFGTLGAEGFSDFLIGDGWHEWLVVSQGNNIGLWAGVSGDFCVDEMEIYEIGANITLGSGWTPELSDTPDSCGLKFCHIDDDGYGNYTDPLIFNFNAQQFKRYRVIIRITRMEEGSVTFTLGDYTEVMTVNKYYPIWHQLTTGGQPTFTPSADFDGCIEIIAFGEQPTQHGVSLYDTDDNFIANVSNYGSVYQDVYTFYMELSSVQGLIPEGCYYFCIHDGELLYGQGGDEFEGALEFDSSTGITLTGSAVITGGQLELTSEGTAEYTFGSLLPNSCYILELSLAAGVAQFAFADDFYISLDGNTIYQIPLSTYGDGATLYAPFTTGAGPITGDFIFGTIVGSSAYLLFDYIRLSIDPACTTTEFPGDAQYCSSCVTVKDTVPCSKQVFGQMEDVTDSGGNTVYKHAYGFHWVNGFRPLIRAATDFHASKYPSDIEQFTYNSGTHGITSAELSKTWDYAIGDLNEAEQDAIRIIARADKVCVFEDFINAPSGGDYYHCPSGDIVPQWTKGVKTGKAGVIIELQKKYNEAVFNRNRW